MRVGLVSPYDLSKPGGVQAQVVGLSNALTKTGDEITIIGPGLPAGMPGVDLGATISIPGNQSTVPISIHPIVMRKIRAATEDMDLLHVHEPLMPTISISALRAGKPVVATFHADPGPVGTRFYRMVGSGLLGLLGRNVRQVTAVSEIAAAPLPDGVSVTIIPNGVDVGSFDRETERLPGRVAFLGRDDRRKGLDVLLAAWDTVARAVPEAQLTVMGADRRIEGVRWMGPVDDSTKIEVLNSSAVYVAPNLGGESFGVVLVEGMAAGAAVLASDLPAFREVGGGAVRYFMRGDSKDLATRLIELLHDRAAIDDLAAKGRRRARLFGWESVAARYRQVYEEALS